MKKSAGILAYRFHAEELQFFLVHPGGPFWKNKDDGAWSIPKGEYNEEEDPLTAAKREFKEETGLAIEGDFIELETVRQKGGKMVLAWAVETNIDADHIQSNNFTIEWPPKSGKMQQFPEVDKAEWYSREKASKKINPSQATLLDQLTRMLEN